MNLGIITSYDEDTLRFASAAGFKSIELQFGRNSDITPASIVDGDADKIRTTCDDLGLTISALACYQNNLDPDETARQANGDKLKATIDAAKALETPIVATFAGREPEKNIEDNIPVFKKVFKPLVDHAGEQDVKIAIEGCPMMDTHPIRSINFATTPETWAMMFDAISSKALGLEYDPSHLLWLECDYIAAIYEFGDRICHVHAKDTEILEGRLSRRGIYGSQWWRYRIPGWGSVDWKRVFAALQDVEYTGDVNIEHEDPIFDGDRRKEGFVRGYQFLSPFFFEMPEVPEPQEEVETETKTKGDTEIIAKTKPEDDSPDDDKQE